MFRRISRAVLPVVLLLALAGVPLARAQGDASCPALVQSALRITGDSCAEVGRNQACYGNSTISVDPAAPDTSLAFNAPGDRVSVTDIRALRLGSMNDLLSEWGVALMKLQATLPDTLPGENVTFVLFGDVQIQAEAPASSAGQDEAPTAVPTPTPVLLTLTANSSVNVRAGPSRSAAVIGSLPAGQQVTSDGKNAAGDWFRIQRDGGTSGWVSAGLVTASGDAASLPVVDEQTAPAASNQPSQPQFPALTAFYLRTGSGSLRCAEAPPDGILIQTPKGVGQVGLWINEARIAFGSTVFVTAAGSEMILSVLEGQINVTVNDQNVWVPAGARVRIPLDDRGVVNGPPTAPEPISDLAVLAAPARLLSQEIDVPLPITAAALADYLQAGLISQTAGNACVPGGVTAAATTAPDEPNRRTVAATVGRWWTARAGVTATFTAGPTARIRSTVSTIKSLVALRLEDADTPFAESGGSNSLTYTFTEDTTFFVRIAGGGGDTLTVTATCQ